MIKARIERVNVIRYTSSKGKYIRGGRIRNGMIFKHRSRVSENEKARVIKEDMRKQTEEKYYLGDLTDEEMGMMDAIRNLEPEQAEKIANILNESADLAGREVTKEITLLPAQIEPTVASYINPRYFIGDEPGLGKTVMSASSYAFYRLKQLQQGKEYAKVIVITESAHVDSFAREWTSYGIPMVAMTGTEFQFNEALEDESSYDGIVLTWDGTKTNMFLRHYLTHSDKYDFMVCDETSKLRNPKASLTLVVDNIINTYKGGMSRVLFLNGTSFEKNIYDFYYQFNVLKPKIIPSKTWLNDRYVIKEQDSVWKRDASGNSRRQRYGKVVDYKNQRDLKKRLRYYFVARGKNDFSNTQLPEHEYSLHMVNMTDDQYEWLEDLNKVSVINSPSTSLSEQGVETTPETSPKIKEVVDHAIAHDKDRPLIYVYNQDSIQAVTKELRDKGYRVAVLNGETKKSEKSQVVEAFNKNELDMLVFNVQKAISIPTSDRIIFYDIPTMPSATKQVKARIDRNNYTKIKHYDFFCYKDSPEMVNMARLGYHREKHAGLFTGQSSNIYSSLVDQMEEYMTEEQSRELENTFEEMYETNKEFKDIESKVNDLLNI